MGELFDIHTLIIQTINLGIIVFLLNKFLFRPYLGYVLEQEKKQKQIEESTETIAALHKAADTKIQNELSDAHKKAAQVRMQAKEVAAMQVESILSDAHEKADRVKKQAEEQVSILEKKLQEQYTDSVTRAAIAVNRKLFRKKSRANAAFIKENI